MLFTLVTILKKKRILKMNSAWTSAGGTLRFNSRLFVDKMKEDVSFICHCGFTHDRDAPANITERQAVNCLKAPCWFAVTASAQPFRISVRLILICQPRQSWKAETFYSCWESRNAAAIGVEQFTFLRLLATELLTQWWRHEIPVLRFQTVIYWNVNSEEKTWVNSGGRAA